MIPQGLFDAMMNGRLVLFVGAGLSRNAGGPDWRGLLRELVDVCKREHISVRDENELDQLIDGSITDMLIAADHLRDVLREKAYEHIYRRFSALDVQPEHRIIWQLPVAGIITTNYDSLLEKAFREVTRTDPEVVVPTDNFRLARFPEKTKWILKLHGTSDAPDRTVLGFRDFQELTENAGAMTTLIGLMKDYTFLFVGFSLSDPDTTSTLGRLRAMFASANRRHYALVDARAIGPVREEFYSSEFHVQVLKYECTADSHPEVGQFLSALLARYSEASEVAMRKYLLVVTRAGIWPGGESENLLLVTNANAQWRIADAASENPIALRAFLLPSFSSESSEVDELKEKVARLLGVTLTSIELTCESEHFLSTKFNPALGKTTRYTFVFVQVRLLASPPAFFEAHFERGGGRYEWRSVHSLRDHPPTVQLNQDVLVEVSRRYGSRLEKINASIDKPLHLDADPYDIRAKTYDSLAWVRDQSLIARIVEIAEKGDPAGILDLGCGPAILGQALKVHARLQYVGFDKSHQMLARGAELLKHCPRAKVVEFDIARDSAPEKYDGWCFVIKNVMHALPSPYDVIASLGDRIGTPTSLIVVETVSPSAVCLSWIQILFNALGVRHKRNWFVRGEIASQLRLAGIEVRSTETREQFIELQDWLESFQLDADRRADVRDLVESMPSEVREEMKYGHDDNGKERLLRLQELHVVNLRPG